jgi:hypothetical protein
VWKLGARPGIGKKFYTDFALKKGFVALGYSSIRDLRTFKSKADLLRTLRRRDPEETEDSAKHLWLFSREGNGIRKNDIVLLYDRGAAWVGRVTSRYFYVKRGTREDYFSKKFGQHGAYAPHRRRVTWLFKRGGGVRRFEVDGRYWEAKVRELGLSDINKVDMDRQLRTFVQKQLLAQSVIKKAHYRKYGGSGEGEEHKRLRCLVYSHPEMLGISKVKERWVDPERPYLLPTGDLPDIVFSYGENQFLATEIETYNPEPGAFQALKYRTLICAQNRLKLNDRSVKAALVALRRDSDLERFCNKYGIRYKTVRKSSIDHRRNSTLS